MLHLKRIVLRYLQFYTVIMVAFLLSCALFLRCAIERYQFAENAAELFQEIETLLIDNRADFDAAQKSYEQTCLHNAEILAYLFQCSPSIMDNLEELRRLAELIEVDEIHIFDETGRMFAGTNPEYFGYTFDSGVQMHFFKPLLNDKSLRLCQNIMPNTAKGQLMQYSALWSENEKFIVQIGMESANALKATEKNEISYLFSLLQPHPGITLYAADAVSGQIMGSTNPAHIGQFLSDIGLSGIRIGMFVKGGRVTLDGIPSYCISTRVENYDIGYVASERTLYQDVPQSVVLQGISLILIAVILACTVSRFTNRYVLQGISKTNEKLRAISEGNLDERVDVRNCLEFSELSDHINDMLGNLLSSTERISYILNRTNIQIGVYEYHEKTRGVRFTEHVPDILRLDPEETALCRGDHRRFCTHIHALRTHPIPGDGAVFCLPGDPDRYIRLEEIVDDIRTLGILMDVTEEISTRKTIETERDVDLLTGLYNRRGFGSHLPTLFEHPESLLHGALIIIDADGLKGINDRYGHSYGDIYLKAIADVLRSFDPEHTLAGRQGGDEFVLFLYGYSSEETLSLDLIRLNQIADTGTVTLRDGLTVPLRFSIGSILTHGRTDYSIMLEQADVVMYQVKRSRKQAANIYPTSHRFE